MFSLIHGVVQRRMVKRWPPSGRGLCGPLASFLGPSLQVPGWSQKTHADLVGTAEVPVYKLGSLDPSENMKDITQPHPELHFCPATR